MRQTIMPVLFACHLLFTWTHWHKLKYFHTHTHKHDSHSFPPHPFSLYCSQIEFSPTKEKLSTKRSHLKVIHLFSSTLSKYNTHNPIRLFANDNNVSCSQKPFTTECWTTRGIEEAIKLLHFQYKTNGKLNFHHRLRLFEIILPVIRGIFVFSSVWNLFWMKTNNSHFWWKFDMKIHFFSQIFSVFCTQKFTTITFVDFFAYFSAFLKISPNFSNYKIWMKKEKITHFKLFLRINENEIFFHWVAAATSLTMINPLSLSIPSMESMLLQNP